MNRFPKILIILAIVLSLLNVLLWAIDWFRFSVGYFGPSFWALLPQIMLTAYLLFLKNRIDDSESKKWSLVAILSMWLFTVIVGSSDALFYEGDLPWPYRYTLLEAFGVPILEYKFQGVAPILGLFHSNHGDVFKKSDWYLDGGILFTWLSFNILITVLLFFMVLMVARERRHRNQFS